MEIKPVLLYVDDEIINLQLFTINFIKKYEIYTADNGYKALELLAEIPEITIVISDMKMPKMNGLEFISTARRRHPEKKYFILTGLEVNNEISEALENGMIQNYLKKPFNKKEIENSLI